MKHLIFLFCVLLFSCTGSDEIKVQSNNASTANDRAGGGISPLSLCSAGYAWQTGSLGGQPVVITSHIEWTNNVAYFTNNYPADWSASYKPDGTRYYIHFRVINNGTATFKYAINGIHWQTLTAGQTKNFDIVVPECSVQGVTFTIPFNVVRLSCGTLTFQCRQISADSPHSIATFYGGDFTDTWNTPSCTL